MTWQDEKKLNTARNARELTLSLSLSLSHYLYICTHIYITRLSRIWKILQEPNNSEPREDSVLKRETTTTKYNSLSCMQWEKKFHSL
jgi:hypothetical protein